MPRLKSLELHGYKTFASKTAFEFPGNITAVVGPNGSGKSNIADSIRWVLGEQAFSLLRGKKTEDMIFTGSEQRPRASMASASIVFNNEDGWLPIDFNEVAITRRAYRDGENEYLINNQRVRLKEINELLSQTGLSERTYTVIGQGLVDAALSLKPEERRKFFEEAAGIGLYRSRRDESLNRLENTRRNIERVNDILAEIKPRISSLERQARKAQEFERIKADLRVLLRDWYGYQWHKTQREYLTAREALKSQEVLLDNAQKKLRGIEDRENSAREEVSIIRKRLDEWHRKMAELHAKREEVSRNLAVIDERNIALKEKETSTALEREKIYAEHEALNTEFNTLTISKNELDNELGEAQTQHKEAEETLFLKKKELEKWELQLSTFRSEQINNEAEIIRAKARVSELTNRKESLNSNIKNTTDILLGIEQHLQTIGHAMDLHTSEVSSLESQLSKASQQFEERKSSLDELEKNLQQETSKIGEWQAQKSGFSAKLDVLVSSELQLIGSDDGIKSLFEDAQKGKISSRLASFGQLLVVPEEYERAIAGALGDFFDSLIIENPSESEDLLSYIEKNDKTRVNLLPKNLSINNESKELRKMDPGYKRASQVIECSADVRKLVDAMLDHVIIVNDRKEARKTISKISQDFRVVTMIGEVFHKNGVITAGKEKRTSLVGRPRQKQELQEAIRSTDRTISASQSLIDELQTRISEERNKFDSASGELEQIRVQCIQRQDLLQKKKIESEQEKHRQDLYKEQQQTYGQQLTDLDEEIDVEKQKIVTTNGIVHQNSQKVDHLISLIKMNPSDELQRQVVHWSTRRAVLVRALTDFEARMVEKTISLDKAKTSLENLTRNLSELRKSLEELQDEKALLQKSEKEILIELSDLQLKISPSESELNEREALTLSFQADVSSARLVASNAERFFSQSQLEVSRQKDRIERLREKIEEDFGLVAFDYAVNVSGPNPLPLDGLVEQLPDLTQIPEDLEENINRQRAQLRRMGPINQEAEKEYDELSERFGFLGSQVEDLNKAEKDLQEIIAELDDLMKTEFRTTFDKVAEEFHQIFSRLFTGGTAKLIMTESEKITDNGVDIEARLPGRREQGLSLLSGGERSLTAAALVFALLKVSPTPFCVLDEVDAMLDEANVGRFCELLLELSDKTQFILITHNRNTVQVADVIYGVTMGKDSASQVISLKMDELTEEMVK
jgi:chromosome segregation protein